MFEKSYCSSIWFESVRGKERETSWHLDNCPGTSLECNIQLICLNKIGKSYHWTWEGLVAIAEWKIGIQAKILPYF